jgi:hypothetical protein
MNVRDTENTGLLCSQGECGGMRAPRELGERVGFPDRIPFVEMAAVATRQNRPMVRLHGRGGNVASWHRGSVYQNYSDRTMLNRTFFSLRASRGSSKLVPSTAAPLMSRVYEALRMAESQQRPKQPPPLLRTERLTLVSAPVEPLPEATRAPAPEPTPEPAPKAPRSAFLRLWRRFLRAIGFRTGRRVPTCNGLTRVGESCRAPAMANGLCRMHGGSRSIFQ